MRVLDDRVVCGNPKAVRTRIFQLTVAAALLSTSALVACAPPRTESTTTLTAAEVAPAAKEAPPPPDGQLVCRSTSVAEGTTELYLEWKGSAAKGTLRRVAPSGETHVQKVQAERYKGMIVADDTLSTDLAIHAATIREHNGKQRIRLGDAKQGWSVCE